ncbi:MAG: hypothetical protein Ct9H300mP28_32640 [Pseudomonadota bacterium]|nr:MAG: hypothetical protein Ct9H300mP28_32640 [Pseudomonadota bacterium]
MIAGTSGLSEYLHNVNDKTWLELFLKEGTKRQIKKMFQKIGYPVQKIKRFQIGRSCWVICSLENPEL